MTKYESPYRLHYRSSFIHSLLSWFTIHIGAMFAAEGMPSEEQEAERKESGPSRTVKANSSHAEAPPSKASKKEEASVSESSKSKDEASMASNIGNILAQLSAITLWTIARPKWR